MKNLFVCKDEKITEKAFSQGLLVSVLSILLCLVALCSMTYAWFTGGTASNSNTLVSGSFDFEVSVNQESDGVASAALILPTATNEEQGTYSYTLAAGTYTVVLDLNNDATAKGYCIVKIGSLEKHTDVIIGENTVNREDYEPNEPFKFTLVVEENDTVVEFKQHWGVSASSSIAKDSEHHADEWATSNAEENQN